MTTQDLPRHSDWLSLAAAPTFAVMAILTSRFAEPDPLCAMARGSWPLGGMVPMYLMMAAFHVSPWVRLISRNAPSPQCHEQGTVR